jgi:hypothetical protein
MHERMSPSCQLRLVLECSTRLLYYLTTSGTWGLLFYSETLKARLLSLNHYYLCDNGGRDYLCIRELLLKVQYLC